MTKEELMQAVAGKVKPGDIASKAALNRVFNAVFDVIAEDLIAGNNVNIPGFGSFKVKERAERKAHNLQTGEEIIVPASKAAVFKPSSALKNAVK